MGNSEIRNITFSLIRANGSVDTFTRQLAGDDEMVEWVTTMYAEENECGCIATFKGQQIAIHGNVQS